MRAFRFQPKPGAKWRHFNLVVFARSRAAARQYVRNQAMSSIPHRELRYVGAGEPPTPEGWTATVVREGQR